MDAFETGRLQFRPLTHADLTIIYDLYRQPEIMKYISGEPATFAETRQLLALHLANHEQYGFGLCAAMLKSNSQAIGRCGLLPIETPDGLEGELAWMFAKAYWNCGLATEFGLAMVEIGFRELGLRRIVATAASQNKASVRVMQKVGMRLMQENERGVVYEVLPSMR